MTMLNLFLFRLTELKVPEYIIENIQKAGAEYKEVNKLEDVIGELDIIIYDKSSERTISLTKKIILD